MRRSLDEGVAADRNEPKEQKGAHQWFHAKGCPHFLALTWA